MIILSDDTDFTTSERLQGGGNLSENVKNITTSSACVLLSP